jgi:hypothetical protein
VDVNLLGLMALYSEVHPTVTYIIHYGLDVLAPVYKLQVRICGGRGGGEGFPGRCATGNAEGGEKGGRGVSQLLCTSC